MTVRCPACGTRFRLPPRSALGARPTFRCSRCEHVFDPEASAEAPSLGPVLAPDDAEAPEEPVEAGDPIPAAPPPADGGAVGLPAGPDPPGPWTTARFAVRTVLLVSIAYAVLSIWIFTHPDRVMAWLADVPLIGTPMSEVRVDPSAIQLADVRGAYHRIDGSTLVFAISGTVINNAPVPVSGVQIEGATYGTVEARATVFAGVAPPDIEGLRLAELQLLQGLVPPADWALGPGEQTSFLVVFLDPVVPLEEFSAEVVAVRRGKGRRAARAAPAG